MTAGLAASGPGTILVGTSGWMYRDWRDRVYPRGQPQRAWLRHLSRRFPTVEINASFYRLPSPDVFRRWGREVPEGFVFAVKMSRYLTHLRRLRAPQEPVQRFWRSATELGPALGPVLFQFPPTFERDLGLLGGLLDVLPAEIQPAFEFRHPTWHDDAVSSMLDAAGAATVVAHRARARVPLVVTGGWSYVRFHQGGRVRPGYTRSTLARWADRLAELPASTAYVYFNNDQGGAAVRDAERLTRLLARRRPAATIDPRGR